MFHAVPRGAAAAPLVLLLTACGPADHGGGDAPVPAVPESSSFDSQVPSRMALGQSSFWEPVPDDGVELGLGWDSREGRVVPNRCVRMAPVHSPGQTTVLSLDEMQRQADVMSALNISAAVSVKTMFASGSATASFASTTRVSSQSTTLLMQATVTNGTLFAAPADASAKARTAYPLPGDEAENAQSRDDDGRLTLHPWARAMLNKPEQFRAYCGDGYVSAITSGARLLASFRITSKEASKRSAAAASIKASYGPANVSGAAKAEKATKETFQDVSIRYMQVGGAEGPIATDREALNDKLKTLATEAARSPRFQDMRVTPYAQLAEVRDSVAWRETDDEYTVIADTYWQLTSLEDDLRYILANYKQDEYVLRTGRDSAGLKDFLDDVLNVRRAIYAALNGAPSNQAAQADAGDAVQLFAKPVPATRLVAPEAVDLKRVRAGLPLRQLAQELQKALPLGNPMLLLIQLPLPSSELPDGTPSDADLQKAVVDYYVRPTAVRTCRRDPTDANCLDETTLDALAQLVEIRPS